MPWWRLGRPGPLLVAGPGLLIGGGLLLVLRLPEWLLLTACLRRIRLLLVLAALLRRLLRLTSPLA